MLMEGKFIWLIHKNISILVHNMLIVTHANLIIMLLNFLLQVCNHNVYFLSFQLIEAFQADNRVSRFALAQAAQLKRPKSYVKKCQLDRDRMICNAIEDLETNVRDVKQFLDATTIAFEFSRTDHGDVNDVVDDVVE